MVQDGWRSGAVVALATGIDPSPLVLPSFSSLLHHTLLLSLSLYSPPPPPPISISLPFLSFQCRTQRYRCIHRFEKHRREKSLFLLGSGLLHCFRFSFLSWPPPPSHFIPIQRISSLCFLILVIFEFSVDHSSSCLKLRKRLRVALGVEMKGWARRKREKACLPESYLIRDSYRICSEIEEMVGDTDMVK